MDAVTLVRQTVTGRSTIGQLVVGGTVILCDTLEPPIHGVAGGPEAIPEGTYRVVLGWSPHFGGFYPHLESVPGRTGILIHPGNGPSDTEGCILLGDGHNSDWLYSSRSAYERVMPMLTFPWTLTVLDAPRG